ncbi:Rv1476 family membrane protein [Rhodococcoides corynebacterioides]|uniref:Rv1476 family membrane protein n=1 Tax=Rhodococcoides corynebacterioides TaxID=53972 RepID=UPI001C9AAA35|nr:DUF6676 family protein [Rhodococcus corynebacterioides]MBY6351255.1 hypothetical protein [Rhodococcus corynebacterioides]MBY6364479.1 hypothetical protein [Rhodococcus corynebacterioides]
MSISHSVPVHAAPAAAEIPPFVDVPSTLADVTADGVSAPAELVPGLEAVVARAQDEGITLNIVVLDEPARLDSYLRDLATEVGAADGGTVLVLGPGQVGTFSDSIDRVTLEAGQDSAYTSDPVLSANQFLDVVVAPGPSWTGLTLALVAVVALVLGATGWANARRWQAQQGMPERNADTLGLAAPNTAVSDPVDSRHVTATDAVQAKK